MIHKKKLLFVVLSSLCFCCIVGPALAGHAPGTVMGWGFNSSGQAMPPAGNDYIAISAGYWHSLSLRSNGTIVGWGYNDWNMALPPAGNNYIAIAAGGYHSLALKSDGSIVGWGRNDNQQATPPLGNDFVAISAGEAHSLALRSNGSIVGWGNNWDGKATPPAGNDFIAISAGGHHSLALRSNGSIVGWGNNSYGQATPPAGNDYIAIAAGWSHSFALKSDGTIVAWGQDLYGQVSQKPAGNDFVAISSGIAYGLALRSDGSIVAWGQDLYGQVSQKPVGNDFVAISAGGFHGLAVKTPFWTSLGGHTLSSIAMDSRSSTGEWFAVIRGTDNHLYFNKHTGSSWVGWTPIGGTTNDEPTVAYTGNNYVHVVIRGTDNGLYYKKLNLNTDTWDTAWSSLGGHTTSAPTLLSWSSSQIPGDPAALPYLWLTVRGTDNHLYLKQWTPTTGWNAAWQSWGGTTYDRPSLAFWFYSIDRVGILTLGIRGTDNQVYTREYTFSMNPPMELMGPWTVRGGTTLSAPIIRYKDGIFHIVVRGADNHVYHKRGSNPYTALGGTTTDMPAVFSWPDQPYIELSIRGTDSRIYDKVLNLNTNQWSGWKDMRGSTSSHPTLSRGTGSDGVLAIRGTDNIVYVHVV